ncbi:MAG: hypothetical protein M1825_004933 [Sarcosagium campestre]|nr:MAG: hypothetical protein M1825_004933 [Sarcosagium campestre]
MDSLNSNIVLILDLPEKSLCGIDLQSFTTSNRFHGIKDLVAGWHFVFASSTEAISIRSGIWFKVAAQPGEVLVKRWDKKSEILVDEADPAQQLRWKANLGSIWQNGVTPFSQLDAALTGQSHSSNSTERGDTNVWASLTDHITPTLLSRITGGQNNNNWSVTTASSSPQDTIDTAHLPLPPHLQGQLSEQPLKLFPIDLKRTWRKEAIGRERTAAATDRSWALGDLITHHCCNGDESEVLGELQFCFLMAHILGNYSCLQQWRRILELTLTSHSATKNRPLMYTRLLRLLRSQLRLARMSEEGAGAFELYDEGASMLTQLIRGFRQRLDADATTDTDDDKTNNSIDDNGGEEPRAVEKELVELQAYVRKEFNWETGDMFVRRGVLELEDGETVEMDVAGLEGEDESGEYAPVVVDESEVRAALGHDGSGVAG